MFGLCTGFSYWLLTKTVYVFSTGLLFVYYFGIIYCISFTRWVMKNCLVLDHQMFMNLVIVMIVNQVWSLSRNENRQMKEIGKGMWPNLTPYLMMMCSKKSHHPHQAFICQTFCLTPCVAKLSEHPICQDFSDHRRHVENDRGYRASTLH